MKSEKEHKEYHKIKSREHFERDRESFRKRQNKIRAEMRVYINKIKDVPCADCGLRFHHVAMDFDHREGEVKKYNVSGFTQHKSWVKLNEEIAKCDIVCSNCHRVRTYDRKNRVKD